MDMTMILGGEVLPKPSTFRRINNVMESDNITLGGQLYTDFVSIRRAWLVTWKLMKEEDFQIIYDLFFQQFNNEEYHTLVFDAYSINTKAKLNISEQNIKYNGVLIENFSITLEEKLPI